MSINLNLYELHPSIKPLWYKNLRKPYYMKNTAPTKISPTINTTPKTVQEKQLIKATDAYMKMACFF